MKDFTLDDFGIKIELDGNGSGNITSELKDFCPHCVKCDCHYDCDMSQAEFAEPNKDDVKESEEDVESRIRYNLACDGIESLILAHACSGVDVDSQAYLKGLETAIQAIGNNL